jgi:peroxiredoxin
MNDTYFKIKKEYQNYKGERYFRFNMISEKAVQVCINHGMEKPGRTNAFGVYLIHRITFLSNYYTINYTEPCTKKEYDKQFEKVIQMLK